MAKAKYIHKEKTFDEINSSISRSIVKCGCGASFSKTVTNIWKKVTCPRCLAKKRK